MKKTYLEYRGGGSSKFWEISVEGSQHTVRFGKIGTDGRSQTKSFKTPTLAQNDAQALTKAKLKKGYAPAKAVASKAIAKENAKKSSPKSSNGKGAAKALLGGKAIPKSGPERAEAFQAIFKLKELPEIERAIELLVAAKPSPAEIDDYFMTAEDGIFDAALKDRRLAYARASLLFRPELKGSKTFHKAQPELAMNQLEYVTKLDPKMAARWADTVRAHVTKNPDLGRQLADAYALTGRVDDAIAVLEAAIKAGYKDAPWNPMQKDKNLSALFKDPRFQKLVGAATPAKKK